MFDIKRYEKVKRERDTECRFWKRIATGDFDSSHIIKASNRLAFPEALEDVLDEMDTEQIAAMIFSMVNSLHDVMQKQPETVVNFVVEMSGTEYLCSVPESEFDETKAVDIAARIHLAGGTYSGRLTQVWYPNGNYVDYSDMS